MRVHDVEQRSDEWYALRLGNPTASEFPKIVTSKGEPSKSAATYAITLAIELFAGKSVDAWEGNSWTERGRETEDEALSFYEFAADEDIQRVGFITDDAVSMGCSPDALVGEAGMVEVKCLKAENHVKAILFHQKHGRCQSEYMAQTQGQILIAERQWCDLLFYHPDLPSLTIRQEADEAIQKGLTEGIWDLQAERDRVLKILRSE